MLNLDLAAPLRRDLETLELFKALSGCLESFKFESESCQSVVAVDDADAFRLAITKLVHEEAGSVKDGLVVELSLDHRSVAFL